MTTAVAVLCVAFAAAAAAPTPNDKKSVVDQDADESVHYGYYRHHPVHAHGGGHYRGDLSTSRRGHFRKMYKITI